MELPLLKETDAKITSSEVLVSALREDFRPAIFHASASVIVVHNHLSGAPSCCARLKDSRGLTQRRFALRALGEEE